MKEMLHVSICDNELFAAAKIESIVKSELEKQHIPCVVELYNNGEDFLKQYQIRDNELIFLDIDMPGKSGIDVVKELEPVHKNKNIILITGFDNLILESLSYCPFQIIRKADMERDIPIGLKRYHERRRRDEDSLEISSGGKVYHIKKQEITYLEKWRNYVVIHRNVGQELKMRGSIRQFEAMLSGGGFVRVHAGCIVNMNYCQTIEKNEVLLTGETKIPVSRDRIKIVREQFMISRRD